MCESNAIIIPIYYGTVAQSNNKKVDNKLHYKWVAFVRTPDNLDLSPIIKSVTYTLHESFDNPYNTINEYPFVLDTYGWGEFEMQITINFKDEYDNFKISFNHNLKFHQTKTSKKPCLSQFYEELIIINPSEQFRTNYNNLISKNDALIDILSTKYNPENREIYQMLLKENTINFTQQEELLINSIEFIDKEIKDSLNKLQGIEEELNENLLEKRESKPEESDDYDLNNISDNN